MSNPIKAPEARRRDPRIEPKPGDVLCRGKQQRRVCVIGPFFKPNVIGVHYINKTSKKGVMSWVQMMLWRTWAKKAEVLHAAD